MTVDPVKAIKIFFCYARKDKLLREALESHLETLRRSGQITIWYDREILPGVEWKREIDTHLNTADIILLLISPNFMRSNYSYGVEMHRALERHKAGDAWIIPVILRPVDWKETPIGNLQVLPANGKPVTIWRNRDEAFQNVAKGITEVVKLFLETQPIEKLGDTQLLLLDSRNDGNDTPYILLIDDDQFANRLAQFALAKEGYEVETVDNPHGAIQMIKRRKPDLLLLDIFMPYMNGFQLAEKLRIDGYKIPFIFVTVQDSLEAVLHGFDIGADDYITKPYHYRVLVVRVRALLRRLYGKAL